MCPLRVAIFEHDPIAASEIQTAVEDAGCIICGIFRDSRAVEAICEEARPDLAIIDLSLMAGEMGSDLANYLRNKGCEIVVFPGEQVIDPIFCSISHSFISRARSLATAAKGSRPSPF